MSIDPELREFLIQCRARVFTLNAGYAEHLTLRHVCVADVIREGTEVLAGGTCETNKIISKIVEQIAHLLSTL